jgi:hypothetical protein
MNTPELCPYCGMIPECGFEIREASGRDRVLICPICHGIVQQITDATIHLHNGKTYHVPAGREFVPPIPTALPAELLPDPPAPISLKGIIHYELDSSDESES